ncbi:MAG: hypothetical protein JRI22_23030 [Deltaproteobacteria bacterium]|nr:hypothetical protein [Deltaproteobacteria bacterium]
MESNKFIRFLAAFIIVMGMGACSDDCDTTQKTKTLKGYVLHGESPVENTTVTLYRAGPTRGSVGVSLGTAQTDSSGKFELPYTLPEDHRAVLYLTVAGPSDAVKLASVLGVPPVPSDVVINERTTIATAYAMAQFIVGSDIGGTYPGLQNAAATLQNLVNIRNGNLALVLSRFPNGDATSTMGKFNSLANMLAACVETSSECPDLFALSTSPEGDVPDNTLQAAVNIAHTPWRQENISDLYVYSLKSDLYEPIIEPAPDNWTLALRYEGNGQELDGPGNIAFDADGNAWVCNNYTFSLDPLGDVCGDDHLLKFTPTGEDFPGAPFQGGGLYGAGFGITLDPKGDVWVGNFGFSGLQCPIPPGGDDNQELLWNSVSKFSSDGVAISPDGDLTVNPVIPGGYLSDEDARPQGMVSDKKGNIWVANCRSHSVTKFIYGDDPNQPVVYRDFGVDKPFDIAIDPWENAWVTSNNNHSIYRIDTDGNTQLINDTVFQRPMGIASDSQGNMWVSNSGALDPPCGENTVVAFIEWLSGIAHDAPVPGASASMIMPDGTPSTGSPYTGGGLYMPWGIAVDGNDNVFVANFNGQRLSHLCGADPSNCPPGIGTGDPISPDAGYVFDGLVRNTGVQIDPSGNVWLANNWEIVPFPANPGGHQMVVFIGLAAPVKTPLIGPPEKP